MNKDQLIVRLTRELYDLKQKLEDIRDLAEVAQYNLRGTTPNGYFEPALSSVIDIINIIDTGEIYEETE